MTTTPARTLAPVKAARRAARVPFAAALVPQRLAGGRDGDRRRAHPRRDLRPAADLVLADHAGPRGRRCSGPSAAHWLGTDQFGRDVLTRLIWSTRVDLRIGFIAVLIPFVVGSILGGLAGYFGGWLDTIVMRLVDIFFAFPFYVMVIVLVFVLGAGETSIYLAIADRVVGVLRQDRPRRGPRREAAGLRDGGAARRLLAPEGARPPHRPQCPVAGDHLRDERHRAGHHGHRHPRLPGTRHRSAHRGMGIDDPDGQQFITTQWQQATIPGLAVVVTSLGLSWLGDGLSDLLSPDRRK